MEAAADRKARLKALKEAAASAEPSQTSTSAPSAQVDEPVLKFRNYAVKDTRIEHQTIEAAQAPEYQEPVPEPSIVQEVQGEVRSRRGRSMLSCLMSAAPELILR